MDPVMLCIMIGGAAALVPDQLAQSGWYVLTPPSIHSTYGVAVSETELWYWDAVMSIWRETPTAFFAETPVRMACDYFEFTAEAE